LKRAYFQNFTRLIPMDRQGSLKASLRLAGETLQQGYHLLIFPEGTRSTDGRMGEFKATLGYLALTYGVDVLPIALSGTFEAIPKGRVLPKGRKLAVAIGPPIPIEQLRALGAGLPHSEAYRVVTRFIENRVGALLRGDASPGHTPPPKLRPVASASGAESTDAAEPPSVHHLADAEKP
jgi:long-chain acyl-CoA synthetase